MPDLRGRSRTRVRDFPTMFFCMFGEFLGKFCREDYQARGSARLMIVVGVVFDCVMDFGIQSCDVCALRKGYRYD